MNQPGPMKTLRDIQAQAHAFLPEIRRTIADRVKIVNDRPDTAEALRHRIDCLRDLEAFLHDLSFITYAEGEPPATPPIP